MTVSTFTFKFKSELELYKTHFQSTAKECQRELNQLFLTSCFNPVQEPWHPQVLTEAATQAVSIILLEWCCIYRLRHWWVLTFYSPAWGVHQVTSNHAVGSVRQPLLRLQQTQASVLFPLGFKQREGGKKKRKKKQNQFFTLRAVCCGACVQLRLSRRTPAVFFCC